MTERQYEYRPMRRFKRPDGTWSLWVPMGNRKAYATIGAARALATQERNYYDRTPWHDREVETKVQRRPVDAWEDFE